MPDLDTVARILAGWAAVAGAFWLLRLVSVEVGFRRQPVLRPDDPAPPPAEVPLVSILVAGKDEEAGIEACVRSLLAQDWPRFEIILVDDRSTDRTPALMDALAAGHPDRVRALHVTELPAGWAGKNNAMRTGIAAARGEWLLMVDADCRQLTPRSVSLALARAADTGADMLSVMAAMEPRHFWDRVAQPLLAGTLLLWFHPARVNDPAVPTAYANGAFLLVKRTAYDRLGGHEAVKAELNEDIHLARLCKAAGLRLHVALNGGTYITRMYDDLPRMVRGWSRILYGSFKRPGPPLATLMLLLLLSSAPTWIAATAGVLWANGQSAAAAVIAPFAAGAWAAQTVALMRFWTMAGVAPGWALLYPIGAAVQAVVLINSLDKIRRGGGISWRGTSYPGVR